MFYIRPQTAKLPDSKFVQTFRLFPVNHEMTFGVRCQGSPKDLKGRHTIYAVSRQKQQESDVELGVYNGRARAEEVLDEMYRALENGKSVYRMPKE